MVGHGAAPLASIPSWLQRQRRHAAAKPCFWGPSLNSRCLALLSSSTHPVRGGLRHSIPLLKLAVGDNVCVCVCATTIVKFRGACLSLISSGVLKGNAHSLSSMWMKFGVFTNFHQPLLEPPRLISRTTLRHQMNTKRNTSICHSMLQSVPFF